MFSHDCETLRGCTVSGRLCDIAGIDAGTTVLAPGLRTEGAAMSNDDHNPMTEDQARDFKVTAKLKRREMPSNERAFPVVYLTGDSADVWDRTNSLLLRKLFAP